MKFTILLKGLSLILGTMILSLPAIAGNDNETEINTSFSIGEGEFLLNGKPFVIRAAELHYPRIPREYWEHRIKMSKALGMNTICLYTFWNIHEQKEGEFNFEGQNDLRKFVELCAENDMKVILRPGPYVCAEWEMGGLPWWLLKKKDIRLREDDPYFMEKVESFQKAVSEQVGDLTTENGGPIIMVQVENEYGSYGEDKNYIGKIRDILRKYFGNEVVMFQCDWNSNFTLNGLDDLVWTMNFGTGADIDAQFAELKALRPDSPLMCSEFWSGWFDKWGAAHETRPADEMIEGIDEMLSKGISFSLYMTHGGTNWGHWAGANSPGYSPDVTSYDYDAPIDESGRPTEKYMLLRETLSKYIDVGETLPEIPETVAPISIDKFTLTEVAPLFSNLPKPIYDENIKTFEEYDMGFGSVLYTTSLPEVAAGDVLTIFDPHDYAQVFIDGDLVGTLDRRPGERQLKFKQAYPEGSKLEILLEATGRINFGRAIKDFKGITDSVDVNGVPLKNWEVYLLPDELQFYQEMEFEPLAADSDSDRYPIGVYRGSFNVDNPSDTFLNFESWGKGLVYVNGYALGRIWDIGPQQTLYMPGPWLRKGSNEVIVFDIKGPNNPEIEGLQAPVNNKVKSKAPTAESEKYFASENLTPVMSSTFPDGNGWKKVTLESPVTGDIVLIEIRGTHNNEKASVAEFYLLDENGNRISREGWNVNASSEDLTSGNHTADKIIDLQESTYWSPSIEAVGPHKIIIDLGRKETISALQYLPRMENGAPGAIKDFKLYVLQSQGAR